MEEDASLNETPSSPDLESRSGSQEGDMLLFQHTIGSVSRLPALLGHVGPIAHSPHLVDRQAEYPSDIGQLHVGGSSMPRLDGVIAE